ncbi:MAG TPA: hypothetical protein PLU52_11770 [Opitutaceae bacterium]|nr:hypothetical protein [Opitutaceae bacterium]HND61357.1 hypothetical protein [Opitutaceae bacterium]
MVPTLYLLLLFLIGFLAQDRLPLLAPFRGLPRLLLALGLTLFAATWFNFLVYVLLGIGPFYLRLGWAAPLALLAYLLGLFSRSPAPLLPRITALAREALPSLGVGSLCAGVLAAFVLSRFYYGLTQDAHGNIYSTFNFVDTAFHLSVTNAFLAAPAFPPMDLDMAPFPLKYHFLADFFVAHLVRLGWPGLHAIWIMNLVSAAVMVGALWAVFQRWLRLPAPWVMLAAFMFLFLNLALMNVVHYLVLEPRYLNPHDLYYGLLRFPYFNFESAQSNMLEPQRGLLFSLPIALLVIDAAFGPRLDPETDRRRLLPAFVLVCLLPLAHIVAFAVLSVALVPLLWEHFRWFLSRWRLWSPAFAVGLLQLAYLLAYGPPTNDGFSDWDFDSTLPLAEYGQVPALLRPVVFWLFANGDYLFWGLIFVGLAFLRRRQADPAVNPSRPVWEFLVRWRWYFATSAGFFLLMNVYRYSFDWGDSNKFVFFLNLGLTLVITLGAAQWIGRRHRLLSAALWTYFLALSVGPPAYAFYLHVIQADHGMVLMWTKSGREAAEWTRRHLPRGEVILTAAYNTMHWVTPLAGHPTRAGIYADSNPYRQDARAEMIRKVFEEGAVDLIDDLGARYVCLSRAERRKYHIHPKWNDLAAKGTGVIFSSGQGAEDTYSVYIFDATKLGTL